MDYLIRVFAAAVVGASAYFSAWLCVGFAWRPIGLLGGAPALVTLLHAVHLVRRVLELS